MPVPSSHVKGWAGSRYHASAEYIKSPIPRTAKDLYSDPIISSALASAIPKVINSAGVTTQTYACSISDSAGIALLSALGFNSSTGVSVPQINAAGVVSSPTTSAAALVKIRIGQQQFRRNVLLACGGSCGVLNLSFPPMLRASHIKPWSVSDDVEKLDTNNGIALSANLDLLFDQGLIAFDDLGKMPRSSKIPNLVALQLGLIPKPGNHHRL